MKNIFAIAFIGLSFAASAQDEFQLKMDDDKKVEYQGVIENADAKSADLYKKAISWCEKTDRSQTVDFKDPEIGKIVAKSSFSTIGKKNAYTYKSYHYTFVCDVVLEFKEGKTRYTLENFKKKASPGEPGSSLEYFIENYKPKVSSEKSRAREAKMLDSIELAIQDQVWDLIDDLKKSLGPDAKDDW
jgi:hypothetical protein